MADRAEGVREAWREYHEATRALHAGAYDQVEPWAWRRLRRRLAALKRATRQTA